MAEAQFVPGAGNIAGWLNSGFQTGASMMERAAAQRVREQQLKIQQEENEREQAKFSILRPALEAKAAGDVAAARNTVAGLETTEAMRTQAHTEMPIFRDEWARASQIDEPGERVRAMSTLLGKAAKYESVAELKSEIEVWKNVFAGQAITERTLAAVDARLQGAKETQAAKDEGARALEVEKAKHAKELQEVKNAAPKGSYTYLVNAMQAARDAGDDETVQLLQAQIDRRNHIAQPYSDAERIKTLDTEAKAAEADGNPALAKSLRDRIGYLTKRGGGKGIEGLIDAINKLPGGVAPSQAAPSQPKPSASNVPPTIKF
jgi:hypothetical protein